MNTKKRKSGRKLRREFLKAAATVSVTPVVGCLERNQTGASKNTDAPTPLVTSTPTSADPGFQTSTFRDPPETPYSGILTYSIGGGRVNVDVYSDYVNDECAQFWNHTKNRLREYYTAGSGTDEEPKITMTLRHFPKPENKWSMFLPCATMDVGVQEGLLALGEFHHRLYKNHFPDYSIRDIEIAANMVGADPEGVIKAGKERHRNDVIKLNIDEGKNRGIQNPLGITVDGEPVEENTADAIEEAIERAL